MVKGRGPKEGSWGVAEEEWPRGDGLAMTLEKWPERGGKEGRPLAYRGVGTHPRSCSLWAGPRHGPEWLLR